MAQVYALPGGGSTTSKAVAEQHGVSTTPTVSQQQQAQTQAAATGTGTTVTIAASPGFQAKYQEAIKSGEKPSQPVRFVSAPAETSTFGQVVQRSGVQFEPKGSYAATVGPTYNELGQVVKAGTDYTPRSMVQDIRNFLTFQPTSPEFSAGVSLGMIGGLITDIAWGGIGIPKPTTETAFKTEARATTGGKIIEARSDILTRATLAGETRTFRAVAEAKPMAVPKGAPELYTGRIAIGEVTGGGGAGATVITPKEIITVGETTSTAKVLAVTPTEIRGIGVGVVSPTTISRITSEVIIPPSAQPPIFSSIRAPIESAVEFRAFPRGTITEAGVTTNIFEKIAITETRGGALGAARGFERISIIPEPKIEPIKVAGEKFPPSFIAPTQEMIVSAPVKIIPSVADITAVRGVEQFAGRQVIREFEATRSMEKSQVIPIVAIRPMFAERIAPITATRLTEKTQVIESQRLTDIITPKQLVTPIPRIAELPAIRTGTMAATKTMTSTFPELAAPALLTPLIPPFIFPELSGGGGFFKKPRAIKGKRKYSYTPSFSAWAFGVIGKAPKIKFGTYTGTEFRPITKGFSWRKILG